MKGCNRWSWCFSPRWYIRRRHAGAKNCGAPTSLQKALSNGGSSAAKVLHALNTAGFDLGRAEAVRVFEDGSKAGDMAIFYALMTGC